MPDEAKAAVQAVADEVASIVAVSPALAAKVVAIALAEVGYREKASNKDLDLATANAGSGNWTKYARDLYAAGYYNGNKNGYAWCDVFVDWCFFKAFGKTEGQLVECQTGTLGAACPYSASYYKAQGRYDREPQEGDQVFFQQGGELVHTGIVVAVSANQVTVVEGNASDRVQRNVYNKSSTYIAGYGHPKYDTAGTSTGGTGGEPAPAPSPVVGEECTVTLHALQVGSTGAEVKTVQRICFSRGATGADGKPITADGEYGANTKAAVVKIQRQLFPGDPSQWDGAVGPKTWAAMLTALV